MRTKELVLQYVEARTALRQCLLESLKVDLQEIFKATPELTGIAWVQYAPHFNDGEPCEFSVGDMLYNTEAFDADDTVPPYAEPTWDRETDTYIENGWKDVTDEAPVLVQEFVSNIQALDDNLMQELFGSDSQVIITPTELKVEDYSERHD